MYFRYFLIIFPWKGMLAFIWTNLNPFYPRLVEIGPGVLEKKIFKFRQCISLFRKYSPWKRAWSFILTSLNSLNQNIVPSLGLKLAQWFLRRRLKWQAFLVWKIGWKCERFTTVSILLKWVRKHTLSDKGLTETNF